MGQRLSKAESINEKQIPEKQMSVELYDPENVPWEVIQSEFNKIFCTRIFDTNKRFITTLIDKQKIYYDFLKNDGCPKDHPVEISDTDLEIWKKYTKRYVCKEIDDKLIFYPWNETIENKIENSLIINMFYDSKNNKSESEELTNIYKKINDIIFELDKKKIYEMILKEKNSTRSCSNKSAKEKLVEQISSLNHINTYDVHIHTNIYDIALQLQNLLNNSDSPLKVHMETNGCDLSITLYWKNVIINRYYKSLTN